MLCICGNGGTAYRHALYAWDMQQYTDGLGLLLACNQGFEALLLVLIDLIGVVLCHRDVQLCPMLVLHGCLSDTTLYLADREVSISGLLVHDLREAALVGVCVIGHPSTRLADSNLDLPRFLSWLVIGCNVLLTGKRRDECFVSVNLRLERCLHALYDSFVQTGCHRADILRSDGLIVACKRPARKGTINGGDIEATTRAVDVPSCNIACWSCDDGVRGDGALSEGRIAGGGNERVLVSDDLDAICTNDDCSGWYHLAVGGGVVERDEPVGGSGVLMGLACRGNRLLLAHRHGG